MQHIDPSKLHEGMIVRNSQGDKIGRIHETHPDGTLLIRRGFFFRDELLASSDAIIAIRNGDAILSLRGDIPGEVNEGRNSASRGVHVAERTDERLL